MCVREDLSDQLRQEATLDGRDRQGPERSCSSENPPQGSSVRSGFRWRQAGPSSTASLAPSSPVEICRASSPLPREGCELTSPPFSAPSLLSQISSSQRRALLGSITYDLCTVGQDREVSIRAQHSLPQKGSDLELQAQREKLNSKSGFMLLLEVSWVLITSPGLPDQWPLTLFRKESVYLWYYTEENGMSEDLVLFEILNVVQLYG